MNLKLCSLKKIIISFIFCLLTFGIDAQITATGKYLRFDKKTANDTVTVFLFNNITLDTQISFTGNGTIFNWYKYGDITSSISNQPSLSPDDATGYILEVDGKRIYIWVLDYKNYLPVYNSIEAENNPSNQCENLNVLLNANITPLTYKYFSGTSGQLPRDFTVAYKTLKWDGSIWANQDKTAVLTMPATQISISAPLKNTTFSITGDQYAAELGVTPAIFTGLEYSAVAVKSHLTTAVTTRTEKNEDMRPSTAQPINYSAPIDVQFLSNANEPVTQFYKWEIFKGAESIITRTDKDHRYTFTDAGKYKVRLTVSNPTCTFTDSIDVTTTLSAIYAPNVFTPNGDGNNDEFRVAYKSIVSFDCWVFNRWGRQVYHWNDPQKGWDGTINGAKAAPGAYFYVIKAKGSDYDPKSTPDSKTHLRLGEYVLKGDINLLRGKAN